MEATVLFQNCLQTFEYGFQFVVCNKGRVFMLKMWIYNVRPNYYYWWFEVFTVVEQGLWSSGLWHLKDGGDTFALTFVTSCKIRSQRYNPRDHKWRHYCCTVYTYTEQFRSLSSVLRRYILTTKEKYLFFHLALCILIFYVHVIYCL